MNKKLANFDDTIWENTEEHDLNWSHIPDHPYKMLVIGGSGSKKVNTLHNLTDHQPDIDGTDLYI